jgi:hypothetical protein
VMVYFEGREFWTKEKMYREPATIVKISKYGKGIYKRESLQILL